MMGRLTIFVAVIGLLPALAASGSALAQSAPPAAPQRMVFVPEEDAAAAKPLAQRASVRPRARRGKPAAARTPTPAKAAAKPSPAASAKTAAAPLPRRAPDRRVAEVASAAGAAPIPPPAPHRLPVLAPAPSAEAPGALTDAVAEADVPAVHTAESGTEPHMNVFAFVAARPPAAEPKQAALPNAPIAPVAAPPTVPLPVAEQADAQARPVARSVAAVFEQIESQATHRQVALVAPAAQPDDALLSPVPVLPPWRASPAAADTAEGARPPASDAAQTPPLPPIGRSRRAAVAEVPYAPLPAPPLPEDLVPEDTAPADTLKPDTGPQAAARPEPAAAGAPVPAEAPGEAALPQPADPTLAVAALPTPSSAAAGEPAAEPPPPAAETPAAETPAEPAAVQITRYRDVPETVRDIGESLPDCTPDETGTARRPFGDRVLFILACSEDAQDAPNKQHVFVLARSEDGKGANVLMFPRPGGGTVGPYVHQLSNPGVIGSRLEITHSAVNPQERPCRTEGRWRVDARGNAGLMSWRTAASCSGDAVAAAPATVKKAAATRGKSAKRPARARGKPAKRKSRRN